MEANRETPFFLCPRLLSSRELAAPQRKDTPKCTSKCHPCRGGLNHVLSKFVLAHKKCNCVPTRECSVFASKNCVLTSRLTMHWELANHASVHHFLVAVQCDQICIEGFGISHAPQTDLKGSCASLDSLLRSFLSLAASVLSLAACGSSCVVSSSGISRHSLYSSTMRKNACRCCSPRLRSVSALANPRIEL